jgi:hypothetical protein
MRVEMLDSVVMAYGSLVAKRVYDLEPVRAQKLIDRKLAKAVDVELTDRPMVKRRVTSLPHGDKG